MNFNSIKTIRPGNQLPKKLLAVITSIAIIVVSFIMLDKASKAAKDTVNVVRVKQSEGIPAKAVLTKDNLEVYSVIRKEYSEDMLTNIDDVVGKYSNYYLRNKSFIYKDSVSYDKPLRNEWLYSLAKENEVLTIPYNYLEAGGDILTPGDSVRIRVAYDEISIEGGQGGDLRDGYAGYSGREKNVRKTETLFEQITVRDLLNSKGHSIYEVYKEVQKLSEIKRQEIIQSRDFLDNILPKSLVLEGTVNQINVYSKYKNKKDISFTITILSRKDNQNILTHLPTIEKEIEAWTAPKK